MTKAVSAELLLALYAEQLPAGAAPSAALATWLDHRGPVEDDACAEIARLRHEEPARYVELAAAAAARVPDEGRLATLARAGHTIVLPFQERLVRAHTVATLVGAGALDASDVARWASGALPWALADARIRLVWAAAVWRSGADVPALNWDVTRIRHRAELTALADGAGDEAALVRGVRDDAARGRQSDQVPLPSLFLGLQALVPALRR